MLDRRAVQLTALSNGLQLSVADSEAKYTKEYNERRRLHNEVMELKGNIRVFCRIRPGADAPKAIETSSCGAKLQLSHNSDAHNFSFDKVFGTASGQDDVFREVDGLVQSSYPSRR